MSGTAAPAVVVGLDCITGLQTARILAAAGIPVVGVAAAPDHFACRTRAVERVVRAPLSGPGLVDALTALGPRLGTRAVLFPCTDAAVLTLSAARDELVPWYLLRLPEHAVIELLMDKVRFLEHAQATGLPVPRTFVLRDRGDLRAAASSVRYPAVVKPPVKTVRWLAATTEKAITVAGADELLTTYDRVEAWSETLLLQEWVSGGDDALYSCNCYYDGHGRPQATFVARKLRQWPPHTGTSCLGEEVRDDDVLATTLSLFDGVGFRGLGYVETKRDPGTGRHWVIEPNVGRPTGRSAIAEAGGVPLLLTQYCDLLGLPLPAPREQQYVGTRWLDLRRDLQSAAYYWRSGELSLRDWAESVRGPKAHAVLSARDPVPFVAELAHVARRGLAAGLAARTAARRSAPAERPADASYAAEIAAAAGDLLREHRASHPGRAGKVLGADGDRLSHDFLLARLTERFPDDAVLSEEGVDDQARLTADRVWIIDPLDGTREYGEGREDWAVHVALWERGSLTAGAVALPGIGVTLASDPPPVLPPRPGAGPLRIAVSRTRPPEVVHRLASRVPVQLVPMGSAGWKAAAVLRGEVDAYLHAGGQYEWDSAAPVVVAQAAGAVTTRLDGSELLYNTRQPLLPDLLVVRPDCVDELRTALDPLLRGDAA